MTAVIKMRWPLWWGTDVGICVRQALNFCLPGVHVDRREGDLYVDAPLQDVREAARYVNQCVKASFPTLASEFGAPCASVRDGIPRPEAVSQ